LEAVGCQRFTFGWVVGLRTVVLDSAPSAGIVLPMARQPPKLRRHVRGQFLVHWAGQDHWLGTDEKLANERHVDEIAKWAEWQQQVRQSRAARPKRGMSVQAIAESFFRTRLAEGGPERLRFYRTHTKRFLAAYSTARADCVRPVMLQRLKDAMLASGLAPRTINHDIQAVKTLFQWGMDLELIPAVNLHGIRKLPLPEPQDKSWTPAYVRAFVLGCEDENLRAHLAINYLCALRPKEVCRIMRGEGRWEQRGILLIPNKVGWKTRVSRRVLFSAEAFGWLRKCAPQWTRSDSYYHAVIDCREAGPHRLRHSAAAHLNARGVPREDVDAILGHYPSSVSLTYTPMRWRHLRLSASRLTLRA
jgi:integrase